MRFVRFVCVSVMCLLVGPVKRVGVGDACACERVGDWQFGFMRKPLIPAQVVLLGVCPSRRPGSAPGSEPEDIALQVCTGGASILSSVPET